MDTCNLFPRKFGANECHCTKTILLGVFRKKNHSSSNNNKKLPQEKLQRRFYICAHKDLLIYWCVRVLWSSIWIAIDWNRLVKHLNNIAINGATFDSMMLVSVSRISKVCMIKNFKGNKERCLMDGRRALAINAST